MLTPPTLPARATLGAAVYLNQINYFRRHRETSFRSLHISTGIPTPRLRAISSIDPVKRAEPWLDEAALLARVLNTDGILPLVTNGNVEELDLGWDPRDDFDVWKNGARLPLSTAFRLALRFGLADPAQLVVEPIQRQIWDVVHESERVTGKGQCPWCAASAGEHRPTCLPHNLLGARGSDTSWTMGAFPQPKAPGGTSHGGSVPGRGLKALRARLGVTQRVMADALGIDPNYLSRLERLATPLNTRVAERISGLFNVPVAELYATPPEFPPEIAQHVPAAQEEWRDRNDPASPNYVDPDKPREPPPGARWASDVSSWSEHLELVASGGSLPLDTAQGAAGENVQ